MNRKEEGIMNINREILKVQDRISEYERQLIFLEQKRAKEVERLAKFGEDDWENETCLMFYKTFGDAWQGPDSQPTQRYLYVAVKCETGDWYTSGPKYPGPYTWEALIKFIGDAEVWIADTWIKYEDFETANKARIKKQDNMYPGIPRRKR